MLTKLTIRNFKRFGVAEIELGNPVVFVGPNNSGKTSALQALALWDIGLKRWNERRSGKVTPAKRPGVTVNRRDLVAIPVPNANLLWRELHVRDVSRVDGRPRTANVRIDVTVEGVTGDRSWSCGLEFDYANEESFYCRPLRVSEGTPSERMPIPDEAGAATIAFLPPMSGLAATETRLDQGAVNVRIGEARTAEVLRNLCFRIHEDRPDQWEVLVEQIDRLFGAGLEPPRYVEERGEITMSYRERRVTLDLSSAGRGLQQTLLLLAYLYAIPGGVLLLDEPDAHLEILRQRQIYRLIADTARGNGGQIIAASHSEVLLNEAADKDLVVAFVGRPHRLAEGDRGSQVLMALQEIGFEQYYQAEQTGLGALSGGLDGPVHTARACPKAGPRRRNPRARASIRSLRGESTAGRPTAFPRAPGSDPASARGRPVRPFSTARHRTCTRLTVKSGADARSRTTSAPRPPSNRMRPRQRRRMFRGRSSPDPRKRSERPRCTRLSGISQRQWSGLAGARRGTPTPR